MIGWRRHSLEAHFISLVRKHEVLRVSNTLLMKENKTGESRSNTRFSYCENNNGRDNHHWWDIFHSWWTRKFLSIHWNTVTHGAAIKERRKWHHTRKLDRYNWQKCWIYIWRIATNYKSLNCTYARRDLKSLIFATKLPYGRHTFQFKSKDGLVGFSGFYFSKKLFLFQPEQL